MSYTPPSEEIGDKKDEVTSALKRFMEVLNYRIHENGGGWSADHLQKCVKIRNELEQTLIMIREEF